MRIGFDAKRAFNNTRGLGNYSRDLIRIMLEHYPNNAYFLYSASEKIRFISELVGNASIVHPQNAVWNTFPSVWRSFGIPFQYEAKELDIFHGLSNEIPMNLTKRKTKTVLTMHDLIFLKMPELYNIPDRILYRKKYLGSCERADAVIAISEQTKKDLIEFTQMDENKISVIHQGCNPIFYQEVHQEAIKRVKEKHQLPEQYFLTVGAIEARKNHGLIVEALKISKIDMPLVIIGRPSGDGLIQLQKLISDHHLQDQVLIRQQIPTEDLPAIYHAAALFVYPSLYEGFGIPLLEALNCGVPVIGSKGSCLEEAGGPSSKYIDPYNAEELADTMTQICSNNELRNQMIQDGYQHTMKFSDQVIASKINDLYEKLL